jgi:hypothetical protein
LHLFKQLHRFKDVVLVGVHDCPIQQHLIHDVVHLQDRAARPDLPQPGYHTPLAVHSFDTIRDPVDRGGDRVYYNLI